MAKAHCDKHKRYVPSCVECQSAALRETVGFPKTEEPLGSKDSESTSSGVTGGGGSSESVSDDDEEEVEEGGDIAEWEPEVVEEEVSADQEKGEPAGLPSYTPSPENACNFHPEGCPEGSHRPEPTPPLEGACNEHPDGCPEPGTEGSHTPADPEGEPLEVAPDADATLTSKEIAEGSSMSPIDMAMFMFPQRLIPEGATEVCDEERPNEPYMASYEELIRRSVAGYLELGLSPEDAVVVVAAEVIHADQLDFEEEDGPDVVDKEGFDAGLEAAPELTGCIENYNQGFNEGLKALHRLMIGYYAGDEDSVAYEMMRWIERQMLTMEKK